MPRSAESQALHKLVTLAIFAAMAVVLGLVEAMIPFAAAMPGAKLGLGNIVVLACLVRFGGKDTLWLIALKILLTAFILGSFSTLLFSAFGAAASFLVMRALLRAGRGAFSLPGVSVAGGAAHNLGQLGAAALVLGTTKIFYYLPFLLVSGVVTGVFVGLAAGQLLAALRRTGLMDAAPLDGQPSG